MGDEDNLSDLKILLVDDDSFSLQLNTRVLSAVGCDKVETAGNGELAIEALNSASEPFDVVICDLMMPDMDGFEFIDAVAEWDTTGGLIILSGEGSKMLKEARKRVKKTSLHILGILSKPLEKSRLQKILTEYRRKYQ